MTLICDFLPTFTRPEGTTPPLRLKRFSQPSSLRGPLAFHIALQVTSVNLPAESREAILHGVPGFVLSNTPVLHYWFVPVNQYEPQSSLGGTTGT